MTSAELALAGSFIALFQSQNWASAIPTALSIAALSVSRIEQKNLESFQKKLHWDIGQLQQIKIDRNYVRSEEFEEIVLNLISTATKVSRSYKRGLLSSALIQSSQKNNISKQNNIVLSRVLDQISEEEYKILAILINDFNSPPVNSHTEDFLMQKSNLEFPDVRLRLRGLRSLQLLDIIQMASEDINVELQDREKYTYYPTILAVELVSWCRRLN